MIEQQLQDRRSAEVVGEVVVDAVVEAVEGAVEVEGAVGVKRVKEGERVERKKGGPMLQSCYLHVAMIIMTFVPIDELGVQPCPLP